MVGHVQAKDIDIDIDEQKRTHYGVFGKTVGRAPPTDTGWWQYRIPGLGRLDWKSIIGALQAAGYDGDIAVEHEDPEWGGTLHKTLQRMRIAAGTLQPLITTRTVAD